MTPLKLMVVICYASLPFTGSRIDSFGALAWEKNIPKFVVSLEKTNRPEPVDLWYLDLSCKREGSENVSWLLF